MITRYRATIGGVHLDEVHPSIYIKDIIEDAPSINIRSNARPETSGSYVSIKKRNSLTVGIQFEVHESDIERRQEVLDKIVAWCDSGEYLTVNYRKGKRLKVTCTSYPGTISSLEWTQDLQVSFTSFEVPYWESEFVRSGTVERTENGNARMSRTVQNANYRCDVNVGGTNETPLEITVKNNGTGNINACTVTAGVSGGTIKMIALSGIEVAPGETLSIGHDENDRLRLYVDNRSVYPNLVATSDDDISLDAGANYIYLSATDVDAEVRYAYRERWK